MMASSSSARLEQPALHVAADDRDRDDKTGMQRFDRIKLPEIARVVDDKNEIAVEGVAHDIPVLPAGTRIWDDRLVPAGMAARVRRVEDAQILEEGGAAAW